MARAHEGLIGGALLGWSKDGQCDVEAPYDSLRKSFRSASGLDRPSRFSVAAWVRFHTGSALISRARPACVNAKRRLRRSASSTDTDNSPRRSSGLRFALSVVRSIASTAETCPMLGASARLSDIKSENWPLVRFSGRSASSNLRATARAARCTCRHMQVSRTWCVIATGSLSRFVMMTPLC